MASVLPKSSQQGQPSGGNPYSTATADDGANNRAPSAAVTPQQRQSGTGGVERHMAVDKNVVDELLLVCGVIGTATETNSKGEQYLVPVTDCLNWLQDLQRALRRDEDMYRPISLLLGKWNVVQQKLLPLVLTCRYDTPMVLTIVKILVILTKPLHENTQRAGRLVIDTKSSKAQEEVIQEQKKLRENALAQSDMLMGYKRAIVHHSSHHRHKEGEGGLLSIFVSLLAEPLSKSGNRRTDADHLTIELVLHLFRNILSAEPILKGSKEASSKSTQLHNECIALFERELVMEILLVICQEMELRENAQYNLLMMELLHHLLKSQDPTVVARCMMNDKSVALANAKENNSNNNKASAGTKGKAKGPLSKPMSKISNNSTSDGSLRVQLARDKQQFGTNAPARHGNFGGTLMLKRPDGKKKYVSASAMLGGDAQGASGTNLNGPKSRKNRKTDPFIGSGRTLLAHTRAGHTQNAHGGPSALRCQKTLHRFCQRFLEKCYGPVMKSLKNEFRRESARLEGDDDKVVLFRIIWFFFQWYRVSGFGKIQAEKSAAQKDIEKEEGSGTSALGQLIFTMDVFTFNLVLNATTAFTTHKSYSRLAQTVALYSEMMHMLNSMYHSKDSTEQIMALGLMDRLFYGNDPVDRLPKLLSSWVPGTSTREYVCDLVELTHVTLKLLDANKKACADILDDQEVQQGGNKKGKKKKPQSNDSVTQMKVAAADFDVQSYFIRKIVSNHVVFMYTKLLDQYATNAPHVNHRIIAFFLRLAKVQVAVGEDDQEVKQQTMQDGYAEPPRNQLALKTATLEPMLYNIQLFMVLNKILNDPIIRNDKSFATMLSWAAGIIHNFATAASTTNPMLFVECLFKHPAPHRFSELCTNMYVNDELRMIAERELLLEEQRRAEHMNQEQSDDEPMEDEEELEFVDTEMAKPSNNKKRRTESDDSSSDDDDGKPKNNIATKRRQFKKLKKAVADYSTSSDEEELEIEQTKPSDAGSTKTSEAAKEQENPRRNPLDDSDDENEENIAVSAGRENKPKPTQEGGKMAIEESSDEEGQNQSTAPSKLTSATTTKRNALEDSSDEEDMATVASKAKSTGASAKFTFDESSDEDEGNARSKDSRSARQRRSFHLSDGSDEEDEPHTKDMSLDSTRAVAAANRSASDDSSNEEVGSEIPNLESNMEEADVPNAESDDKNEIDKPNEDSGKGSENSTGDREE